MTRPGGRNDNASRVAVIVQRLALAYCPYGWQDASVGVYVDMLADIGADALAGAADRWMATQSKMPMIAQLRRLVLEDLHGETPSALEAWETVLAAIHRHGRYARPVLPRVTMRAIETVGGWRHICDTELLEAVRSQFMKAYDRLLERAERDALVAPGLGPVLDAVAVSMELPPGPVETRSRAAVVLELMPGDE